LIFDVVNGQNAHTADIVIAVIATYLDVERDIDLLNQLFIASFQCYCYEQNKLYLAVSFASRQFLISATLKRCTDKLKNLITSTAIFRVNMVPILTHGHQYFFNSMVV